MPTFQTIQAGMGPLQREWLDHINSGSMHTVALGSGVAVGTFDTDGGFLKGVFMTTPNTPELAIRDGEATIAAFGSGGLAGNFQPCWFEYKNELTVSKLSGTAETWYLLVATSGRDVAK